MGLGYAVAQIALFDITLDAIQMPELTASAPSSQPRLRPGTTSRS
jgi:hypothetical protein